MKSKITLIMIIGLILIVPAVYSQIFLGTVQGYITNSTGGNVSGAYVEAQVSGLSGAGSSGSTYSQADGFYIIANLDMSGGETITVSANKSNAFGTNTTTADGFGAAYANVTLEEVPFPPSITTIADTHNNTLIVFNWTSGTDPQGSDTYDVWQLVGVQTINNASAPVNKTYLDFDYYTWRVKTCSVVGCSAWTTDAFNLSNSAPPAPILDDVPDGISNQITFNWTSGGADPDGDTTYFVFDLDGDQTIGAIPPLNETVSVTSHTWKVKECDDWECSAWSQDTFTITNDPPSTPSLVLQNHTTQTSASLNWTSGVDPELAGTYDEFKLNDDPVISPATAPIEVNLSGIQRIVWKVRTCDISGSCSAYNTSTFIKFECIPEEPGRVSQGGGGGGGSPGIGKKPLEEIICRENWMCSGWEDCRDDARQTRQCWDINECGKSRFKPREERPCTPAHCYNSKKDSDEEGIDCGGKYCKICVEIEEPGVIEKLRSRISVLPFAEPILNIMLFVVKLVLALILLTVLLIIFFWVFFRTKSRKVLLFVRLKRVKKKKGKARKDYVKKINALYKKVHNHMDKKKRIDNEILELMKEVKKWE